MHCMHKPRLRAPVNPFLLETAPARTPQSIANGELSSRYCNKVALHALVSELNLLGLIQALTVLKLGTAD